MLTVVIAASIDSLSKYSGKPTPQTQSVTKYEIILKRKTTESLILVQTRKKYFN
jgi:hypothetical protein